MKRMVKTEQKHWVNGHHVRGKDFHTFAYSLGQKAIMLSFSYSLKHFSITFYKIV